ncbi:DNA mismatch repair endonuclease MutL [Planctomycetota bacterium]
MGVIVVLDPNMINMIAAGEVIERPASVVKELIENSIDAGASKITVSVEDGGRKLISITDNGCGIDAEDLARAFESHATSKIKTSHDLGSISTLGFRGEALASIASIAQVRMVSRTADSNSGNCVEIDCGDKTPITPCSADHGTTIQVRDIFYKLPARRKFLKTANTEMSHISECFTRIALSNRKMEMTLKHNGRELYSLAAGQSIRQRVAELFSAQIAENLIETKIDEKNTQIFALLGKPSISRGNSKLQYVFLNGRFIRDKFISHAIREAYRANLEPNRFPVIFLFLQMPFEDYDVNVHPTKIEVRFYNSNLIHSQILGVIREKLLATNLDVPAKMPEATQSSQSINDAMSEFFKKHRPIQTQQQLGFHSSGPRPTGHELRPTSFESRATGHEPWDTAFIQIDNSYIIAPTDDGFIVVDQHALHERIMYENLKRRIQAGNLESQKLLIPESFELTDAQAQLLKNNTELIAKLGVELVPFGPKTMAVQSFPTLLAKASPIDFVHDLIDLLTDKAGDIDADTMLDEVLNMAACKAAIKAGQKLTASEIQQLLADKETFDHSSRCAHGRPTTITFSIRELEKQFKRT